MAKKAIKDKDPQGGNAAGDNKQTVVYHGSVTDLIADDQNANDGSEYGDRILEKSLTQLGVGRSVVVDKDNRLIAGNKTAVKCVESGINKAIIVETTGDQLVVVKRVDLSLDSKRGRELALADNKVGQVNLDWNFDIADNLAAIHQIDGDFMPTKPTRKGSKKTITITFDDEIEMDEALEEIRQMSIERWQTAEVKAKK